jgi:hypothetical protein
MLNGRKGMSMKLENLTFNSEWGYIGIFIYVCTIASSFSEQETSQIHWIQAFTFSAWAI